MKQRTRWIFPITCLIIAFGIIYQSFVLFQNIEQEVSYPAHFPYRSFAYITIDLEMPQTPESGELPASLSSRGSGLAVGTTADGHTAILTANHVCNPPPFVIAVWNFGAVKELGVTDFFGNTYEAKVILNSIPDDLCLLEVQGFPHPTVPFSNSPVTMGEKVYSVAAPLAFFNPGMVPLLEGYYSGDTFSSSGTDSVYTIPAREGSSGSSVLNERGEIVGVVHSSLSGFNHIAISATHSEVNAFLTQFETLLNGTLAE